MLDLNKIDFKKVDVDVDEDGLMWLVEENDWKSAAEETAMSDIKEEYMDKEWIDMHDEVFSKVKK
jgi:hypothetical protein